MEKTRRHDAKTNRRERHKSFARLFKGGAVKDAESLSRSAEREISHRRFFLLSFFFAPLAPKKKRLWSLRERTGERKRREPFSGKGLPSAPFPRPRGNVHTTLPKALEQMEKKRCRNAKQTGEIAIKVFAPLFSKSGTFSSFFLNRKKSAGRGRRPPF